MLLWIILAAMTGLAAFALLWPLARAHAPLSSGAREAASLYMAQLSEIDRDLARGLIEAKDVDGARAEAGRRLLRAEADAATAEATSGLGRRKIASLLIICLVPLAAFAVYARLGTPDLPGQPLSARLSTDPAKLDVDVAVARIEAHLALNPADSRGWDVIAPVYMRMGRVEDAEKAFAAAIRHGGETPDRLAGLGEAQAVAASGVITAEARSAFERAVVLDPAAVRPRFFLAVALEQDGQQAEALAAFRALVAGAPADAPWLANVNERIARLEGSPASAIAALAPPERMAAIRGMVQGLAERLQPGGGTLEEWLRLIRAQGVLGDTDAARTSLVTAQQRLEGQGGAADALTALGQELGLSTGAKP
jgi:cytochrome c-type biogenesis protein CcmH